MFKDLFTFTHSVDTDLILFFAFFPKNILKKSLLTEEQLKSLKKKQCRYGDLFFSVSDKIDKTVEEIQITSKRRCFFFQNKFNVPLVYDICLICPGTPYQYFQN